MGVLLPFSFFHSIRSLLRQAKPEVVYSPKNTLSCGARVWIEIDNDVELDNDRTV